MSSNEKVRLIDFETEEEVLIAWRQAKTKKRKIEEQKTIMEALHIIAEAGFVTENEQETIEALKNYEAKITKDFETQIKRNFTNPEKINYELKLLLEPYRPKFEIVKKALHILQSSSSQLAGGDDAVSSIS